MRTEHINIPSFTQAFGFLLSWTIGSDWVCAACLQLRSLYVSSATSRGVLKRVCVFVNRNSLLTSRAAGA